MYFIFGVENDLVCTSGVIYFTQVFIFSANNFVPATSFI